ncbi:MAG: rubredoxin [Oscillospiraceae bacterium]|nr:rubredoxin [Oscillospiraceae bacterium]
MAKYVCSVCGYLYDEAKGIPEVGIAPGTAWVDLPEDWICPLCGAAKSEFHKQGESAASEEKKPISVIETSADMKEMPPLEIGALCTNWPAAVKNSISRKKRPSFMNWPDILRPHQHLPRTRISTN